jgi:exonuclease VII small subunit
MSEQLEDIVAELERVAERLRAGDLEPDEAAELVERCAELAGRLGGELERRARAASGEGPPGQERLL